jgi:predicted nuclease with TOPRIM domain
LENIALNYKNKPFDDLIKSTTQLSIRRDMQLVGHNPEIKPILSDLLTYFNAEELLKKKFAAAQIEKARTELNQIQQKSDGLLEKLKNALENYQTFNDGFKEMTEKIVALDNKTLVDAMPENIRKQKFYDILSEISSYIFNYDFNLSEYPYLSDIMLEILNRKQPNPDANISYLLNNI